MCILLTWCTLHVLLSIRVPQLVVLSMLTNLSLTVNYEPSHTEILCKVKDKYVTVTAASIRKYVYSSTCMRLVGQKEYLTFNHRCQRYGIVPSFLKVKPLVRSSGPLE